MTLFFFSCIIKKINSLKKDLFFVNKNIMQYNNEFIDDIAYNPFENLVLISQTITLSRAILITGKGNLWHSL